MSILCLRRQAQIYEQKSGVPNESGLLYAKAHCSSLLANILVEIGIEFFAFFIKHSVFFTKKECMRGETAHAL